MRQVYGQQGNRVSSKCSAVIKDQHDTVVRVSDSSAKGPWFNSWLRPPICFHCCLLHLTCGAGTVDGKELAVIFSITVTPDCLYTSRPPLVFFYGQYWIVSGCQSKLFRKTQEEEEEEDKEVKKKTKKNIVMLFWQRVQYTQLAL